MGLRVLYSANRKDYHIVIYGFFGEVEIIHLKRKYLKMEAILIDDSEYYYNSGSTLLLGRSIQ